MKLDDDDAELNDTVGVTNRGSRCVGTTNNEAEYHADTEGW